MSQTRSKGPRLPKALRNPARSPFLTDRPCPQCEYNLIGLTPGMLCPECGAPIVTSSGASAADENLTSAPRNYLIVLSMALGTMTFCAFVGLIALSQPKPQGINWVVLAGIVAAVGWAAGIFVATQPRPQAVVQRVAPRMQQRHARWIARLTQMAWVGLPLGLGVAADLDQQAITAAATTGAAFVRPQISVLLTMGAWIASGIGVMGLLVVCYMLADLADWASDSPLAERLRLAGLGLPIGLPLALAGWAFHSLLGPLTLMGLFVGGAAALAAAAAGGAMFIGVAQLTYLSVWAIKNKETQAEVQESRDLREREYDRDMVARLDPTPIAPQPNLGTLEDQDDERPRVRPATEQPLVIPSSEHVVPRPGQARPYELAEDEGQA